MHLKKFLDYLEKENIYDVLIPTVPNSRKTSGFKINTADQRFNDSVKVSLRKCTRTFISTLDKKSIR